MSHIAFLGTGLLGGALVEAAATRGERITVWNRTAEKARALEAFGVTVAATPADAARGAERVHLVLRDDAVVEEVVAALRPGLAPDAVIVDHTTTQPALTAERARRLNAEGVRYLHCPVFIGPAAARQGQGTILAAGPRGLFDAVQPALARMAPKVEYVGERPDAAAVLKLCGNAFIIGLSALVADTLSVAGGAGVPGEDALRVIGLFNPSSTISGRGRLMAAGDWTPSFELSMARKDVRLMLETADGRPLAALPSIAARMDALIAEGHGGDDLAVLGRDARP
ncbi:NAD(P)-dependent oxidoreductase [Roseisolibacter sp. H3M3-2]|uniref:NAD(P)-dependent oxidoreductase n=1 Tax=Roseisolibacter sp. H3M3-2 TaxID=3031323 RepID=UPI0023DA2E1B|nr:NAD(P)-dependent oxidoreductase [Roseisolibacter sp. H3M3-2]MDF1503948.1 NAD(P)-dependent oxidoreductase [Roseisolibacter sp. H3M3-2]